MYSLFSRPLLSLSVVAMLLTPALAIGAPDMAMRQSLQSFFSHGVVLHGATAELVRVERWPNTSGRLDWSMPDLVHGHPGRFSLIATQGGQRWYVAVRVRWMTTAIVMRQNASARSLLTQAMMEKKRTDIAGLSGAWWQDAGALVGMRLTRPMAEGDVILSDTVKKPPLIKRGDIVTIQLDAGGVHILSRGLAMRTARQGERILVKNLNSNGLIQATAVRADLVRVSLNGEHG